MGFSRYHQIRPPRKPGILPILLALWCGPSFAAETQDPVLETARKTFAVMNNNEEFQKGRQFEKCLSIILNNQNYPKVAGANQVKLKLGHVPSSIRPAFSSTDVHGAQAAFSTVNGFNFQRILHDSGLWPTFQGSTDTDDGISEGNNLPGNGQDNLPIDEQAGEIYDVDGNGHFPAAVLRALGSRCYVFLPTYLFPTLPRGIDPLEGPTPPAPALSRFFWVDSGAVLGKTLFWSPTIASGSSLLEPRFLFGFDKNMATAKMQQFANEFDSIIYPRISDAYGNPPDIDADPRIYFLVDDIRDGSGNFRGYFNSSDQMPLSINGFSNAKELLYIDAFPSLSLLFNSTLGTIAHEFVHLIVYNENGGKSEERWIDEGMADLGRNIYDGSETTNVDAFIRKPDTALVSNDEDEFFGPNTFAHRGNGYLFSLYLIEKYGKGNPNALIRKIAADDGLGVVGINNALKDQKVTFEDVFKGWIIANHLDKTKRIDGTELNKGLWGYNYDNDYDKNNDIGTEEKLPVKLAETKSVGQKNPFIISSQVNDTAADYIQVTGSPGDLNIAFDGDDMDIWSFPIIKKSDTIDPEVEWVTLDPAKRTGQAILKSFGTGNVYKELVLVPNILSVSGNSNAQSGGTTVPDSGVGVTPDTQSKGKIMAALPGQRSYVISGSFNNLEVAVWPNPIHENELLVAVKSKNGFSQPPSAVLTYGGEQRTMVLSGITSDIYLSHFTIADSGEGTIVSNGQDSNGLLLKSTLNFAATHINSRAGNGGTLLPGEQPRVSVKIRGDVSHGNCHPEYQPQEETIFFHVPGSIGHEMPEVLLHGSSIPITFIGQERFKASLINKLKPGINRVEYRLNSQQPFAGMEIVGAAKAQCQPLRVTDGGASGGRLFHCDLDGHPGDTETMKLQLFNSTGALIDGLVLRRERTNGTFQSPSTHRYPPGVYGYQILPPAASPIAEGRGQILLQ